MEIKTSPPRYSGIRSTKGKNKRNLGLIRVIEDLIDILIDKNVFVFTTSSQIKNPPGLPAGLLFAGRVFGSPGALQTFYQLMPGFIRPVLCR